MKNSVILYGNSFKDSIYYTSNECGVVNNDLLEADSAITRYGGIHNVKRAMDILDSNIHVETCPLQHGLATIVINRANATKTSIICTKFGRNIDTPLWRHPKVAWSHIAYLDLLPYISHEALLALSLDNIVSADLCLSSYSQPLREAIIDKSQYIDYLFMSSDQFTALFPDNDPKNIARLATIVHDQHGSTVYMNNDVCLHTRINPLISINVLGAGDAFVASFIVNTLQQKSMKDAIKLAHKQATELIINEY